MIRLRERGCRACKHRPPHDIAMGGDAAAVLAHCVVLYADDALCGSDGPARSGQGVDRLSGLDGIAEEGIAGCIAFRTCDDAESCRRPAAIDRLDCQMVSASALDVPNAEKTALPTTALSATTITVSTVERSR